MKRKTTITLMILMLIIALCGCSSKSANTIQLWDPAEEQAQAAHDIGEPLATVTRSKGGGIQKRPHSMTLCGRTKNYCI